MKKIQHILWTLALCTVMVPVVTPVTVTAQGYDYMSADPGGLARDTDFANLLMRVVKWILGFTAALAILMIIFGGIMYIVSSGDSGRIDTAKNIILYAVMGLIVILLSYAIVASISRGLGAG